MSQQLIPIMVLAALLAACSGSKKLMPAEALHMDDATTQAYPSRFYDDNTHIRYDFRNDDKNLYVILETDNAASKMRILREGVKIYFSSTGSKTATRYIQYPYNSNPTTGRYNDTTANTGRPFSGKQQDDDRNYTLFYKQAALMDNGKIQLLDINNPAPGALHFSATSDANGFFRYVAAIPKNQLAVNKNNTVIGISIAGMKKMTRGTGHGTPQTHFSAGGNGMRGGGMHGGRGSGGMHGAAMRGGNPHENRDDDNDAGGKIDWWYKVALVS